MLNIKKTLTKILDALKVDYIVEEGTVSTYCKYRKWNSGKAECWYAKEVTGITTATWTSPIYYVDSSSFTTIWNGLFNAAPDCVLGASNNSQIIGVIPFSYTKNGVASLRLLTVGAKTNISGVISIYAVGTWK